MGRALPVRGPRRTLRTLCVVVAVIAVDILALLFVPPCGGQPGAACNFPVCYINGR
jgi:hypothetical protein